MCQEGSPEEILQSLFRIFDTSGDGKVTMKEMEKLVKSLYGLLKVGFSSGFSEHFHRMSINHTGEEPLLTLLETGGVQHPPPTENQL